MGDAIGQEYFLDETETDLATAKAKALAAHKKLFVVFYDSSKADLSQLHYGLKYFMGWLTTKELVHDHLIAAVVDAHTFRDAAIPVDEPLEECFLVAYKSDGTVALKGGLVANGREGWNWLRAAIDK